MKPRHLLLALALAATLAAVWQSRKEGAVDDDSVVAATPRHVAPVTAHVTAAITPADKTAASAEPAARFAASGPDLFPPQSWKPPPAPAPVVVVPPPPPPQAPPLPFKYIGRWDAGDGESIFLAEGDRVVSVRVGQNLAQWHLDSINAGGMMFTFIPLQQQRQLRFGP